MTIAQLVFAAAAFVSGALPFSLWVGRWALDTDIRAVGDGNPGTFNVLRAGGIKWAALALILDITKGALPVGLAAHVFDWEGIALIVVAIAPVLGHAFSPFLGFRGGKAVATTMGIWIGLTLWTVPLVGVAALVITYRMLSASGWAVMLTAITVLIFPILPLGTPEQRTAWVLNAAVLAYKHRSDLIERPRLRSHLDDSSRSVR